MSTTIRSLVVLIGVAAITAAVRSGSRAWEITVAAGVIAIAAAVFLITSRKKTAPARFGTPKPASRLDVIRRFLHLSLVLAAVSASAATPPEEADWRKGKFILPDRFYVAARCREVSALAKRLDKPAEDVRKLFDEVAQNCAAVEQETLSAADWVEKIEPVIKSISKALPCPNCVNIDASREVIPPNLKTYTLLLVPSDGWLVTNPKSVGKLRTAFLNFGRSIGPLHGAIWLSDVQNGVDVVRSKDYADRFGLAYGDGPYIVFTERRPDLAKGKPPIVVRLDGLDVAGTIKVLDQIARELRNGRKPDQTALLLTELKEYFVAVGTKYPGLLKRFIFGG